MLERQFDGSWLARPERYAGIPGGATGFVVMSEDEIARLSAPITTPVAPPQPPLPPLPAWADRPEVLPPYQEASPPPATPGFEPTPVAPDDHIITRDQEEQRRFRGRVLQEAFARDPNFRPELYGAHHIIPLNEYPDLQGLREKLALWDIDLNSVANGVPLPKNAGEGVGTPHRDTQGNPEYRDALLSRFSDVQTRDEALFVLQQVKEELRQNTFVPRKGG